MIIIIYYKKYNNTLYNTMKIDAVCVLPFSKHKAIITADLRIIQDYKIQRN